jgi:hypothetical protein
MAREVINNTKLKAVEFKKFDGVANKTSFSEIKNNILNCDRIDLIPKDRIVKLNIRWAELYAICSTEEWNELYKILDDNNIKIVKKGILSWIADVFNFFFIQPAEWLRKK